MVFQIQFKKSSTLVLLSVLLIFHITHLTELACSYNSTTILFSERRFFFFVLPVRPFLAAAQFNVTAEFAKKSKARTTKKKTGHRCSTEKLMKVQSTHSTLQ